jgi:RNA polymerase sigma-70 factor (ECF subfamily)
MTKQQRQFEALVNAHSTELFRYAYAMCRNRHQAEDLVQETYLRAWRAKDSLRDHRAARSWLYTILRREFFRLGQRTRPETRDPAELQPVAAVDYDTSTEAFAVRRAIDTLITEDREPLLLQVIGGFSCSEIADLMDSTPNAIMARLSRVRRKLRDQLSGNETTFKHKGKSS